jgi:hypothetical protein
VHVVCVDDEAQGAPIPVLWEYELDGRRHRVLGWRQHLMTPELLAAHQRQASDRKFAIDLRIITLVPDLAPNFEHRPLLTAKPRNGDARARSQGRRSKLSLPIDPSAPLGVANPQYRPPGDR